MRIISNQRLSLLYLEYDMGGACHVVSCQPLLPFKVRSIQVYFLLAPSSRGCDFFTMEWFKQRWHFSFPEAQGNFCGFTSSWGDCKELKCPVSRPRGYMDAPQVLLHPPVSSSLGKYVHLLCDFLLSCSTGWFSASFFWQCNEKEDSRA